MRGTEDKRICFPVTFQGENFRSPTHMGMALPEMGLVRAGRGNVQTDWGYAHSIWSGLRKAEKRAIVITAKG